jgi:hypothetical protein
MHHIFTDSFCFFFGKLCVDILTQEFMTLKLLTVCETKIAERKKIESAIDASAAQVFRL